MEESSLFQSFVSVERINQFLVGEDLDDDCVSHDSASGTGCTGVLSIDTSSYSRLFHPLCP